MSIGPAPDWQDISWMVGQYEGTPIIIAVDADGKIINVMQATYAGVLKPVACDADGRIIMIPTDPADVWGNAISMGNAELAAVLSSARRYDRRGNVVFLSNFATGLGEFGTNTIISGSAITVTSSITRTGPYAVKFHTAADALAICQLIRYQPYLVLGKVGVEIHFSLAANIAYVQLTADLFDGITAVRARVKYIPTSNKWQYESASGVYTDLITSYPMTELDNLFHAIKLVADYKNRKFVRFMVNAKEQDMSTIATWTDTVSEAYYLLVKFECYGEAAAEEDMYVDDICITVNE